jgi:hypothetical protein
MKAATHAYKPQFTTSIKSGLFLHAVKGVDRQVLMIIKSGLTLTLSVKPNIGQEKLIAKLPRVASLSG